MEISYNFTDQHILEEDYDENYEPTEEEVLDYCKVLKLDPLAEKDLLYIAREGIKAPLPKDWKPIEDAKGNIYYFNFATGASTWEHPCDEFYRKQLEQEREKKRRRKGADGSKGKKESNKLAHPAAGMGMASRPVQVPGLGLAPLVGEGGGRPLPALGGLPPLKKAPTSLAPLRVPPVLQSQTGSSLGSSLTSTGGGTGSLRSGNRGPAVGSIELGTVRISTQFEEEDEESDSELDGEFRSKFGENLLGAEDLGLEDSDEEGGSSEEVSRELRRVLELDRSEDESEGDMRDMDQGDIERPSAPLPTPSIATGVGGREEGEGGMDQPFSPRLRPGAARGNRALILQSTPQPPPVIESKPQPQPVLKSVPQPTPVIESKPLPQPVLKSTPRPLPVVESKPLPQPVLKSTPRPPPVVESKPLLQLVMKSTPQSELGQSAGVKGGVSSTDTGSAIAVIAATKGPEEWRVPDWSKEIKVLEEDHMAAIESAKQSQQEELRELREKFEKEVEQEKASLEKEKEVELATLKNQLASEQVAEEKRLRSEQIEALEVVKGKVREEEEEEEARLMEAKQDRLRKLRQQISQEQEQEERQLKERKENTLRELRQHLQGQQATEESSIRVSAGAELQKLRERLAMELEEERAQVKAGHEQELKSIIEKGETEMKQTRAELEQRQRQEVETLVQEMKEQQKKAVCELQEERTEEARLKAEQARREAEETLQTEMATFLEARRAELQQQHEEELEVLRVEMTRALEEAREEGKREIEQLKQRMALELKSTQKSLTEENEVALQQVKEEVMSAQRQYKQRREEQSQELAAMQSEYERRKEELEQLLQSVDQQRSEVEERWRHLQEEEAELKSKQEHLGVLQKAGAHEVEQLLQHQQADTVERVSPDLEERSPQRTATQDTLISPPSSPLCISSNVAPVPATSTRLPPSSRSGKGVNLPEARRERVKVPRSHDSVGEEIESDDSQITAGSMRVQELTTRTSSPKQKAPHTRPSPPIPSETEEESSLGLEQVKLRLAEKQRDVHRTLTEERQSVAQTRKYLKEQQRGLKRRRTALRQAHHKWSDDMKTFSGRHASGENDLSLLKDIRTRLEQEAVALAELEDRMKSSHQLLTLKEQKMKDLQASLRSEAHASDHEESSTPPHDLDAPHFDDIPPPSTYLAQLRKRLERSQQSARSSKPGASYLLSMPPAKPQLGRETSGESSDSSSELSAIETETVSEYEKRQSPKRKRYSPSTQQILLSGGGSTAAVREGDVMVSLCKINTQLGELLTKFNRPAADYPGGLHSSRSLRSTGPLMDNELLLSTPLETSSRWAEPAVRGGPHHTERELHRKRHSYLGGHSSMVHPGADLREGTLYPTTSIKPRTVSATTEELLRNQTDWLKEFQQSVPLSSRLAIASHTHLAPAPRTNLPKPRLTLDGHNNIQLVHL